MGVQGAKLLAGARGALALLSLSKRAYGPPEKIMTGCQTNALTSISAIVYTFAMRIDFSNRGKYLAATYV